MKRLYLLGLLGVLGGVFLGCGGGDQGASPPGTGRAVVTIVWPERSRLIPVAAESIAVVIRQGQSKVAEQTADRPAQGNKTDLIFDQLPVADLVVEATAYPQPGAQGIPQATASAVLSIKKGQTTRVSLTMVSTIDRLEVAPDPASVVVGETLELTATAKNAAGEIVIIAGSNLAWRSEDTGIATVNATTGVVTGASAGSTHIVVTEKESQKTARVPLTVVSRQRSVIIMISDGCGYPQIDAANLYQYGQTGRQVYESFPVKYAMSTFSADGHGYDPVQAWNGFAYILTGYTDSASAGTAMSSGFKTYDAAIGVDVSRQPVKHVMEAAEELGKATGVITSVPWSHATPASFVAHNVSRNNYAAIAQEMIQVSKTDVIMGCGNPNFDDDGLPASKDPKYVGGQATWDALVNGTAGTAVDADHNGSLDDAWKLIQTRAEFQNLANGATPKRVCGTAQVYTTLQQARSGGTPEGNPFDVPLTTTVPTLAEMTRAALNVLDDDPDGFVLMIEGGAVDWACHANQKGRTIEEEMDFNQAVEAVMAWLSQTGRQNDTLLIVTGDHETGGLSGPGSDPAAPLINNGAGKLPGMEFHSVNHTNALVPLFATGPGADLFQNLVVGTDPVRGPYIDNTAVARVLFQIVQEGRTGGAQVVVQ